MAAVRCAGGLAGRRAAIGEREPCTHPGRDPPELREGQTSSHYDDLIKALDAVLSKEKIAALVPMKRAGRPEEVAELTAFLASDRAAYISGQVISINGGIA